MMATGDRITQENDIQAAARGERYHAAASAVWANRKRVVTVAAAAGVIALTVSFLVLPEYYRSSATLLPETEKNKMGGLSQFAGLASLAGVNVQGADVSRLYPVIAISETVLRNVIGRTYQTHRFAEPVNLVQFFGFEEDTPEENMDRALRRLRDLMSTSLDTKTGTVTITLEMREPQLAADVLNAVVDELDQFMRLKKITSASEQARWISQRVKQVDDDLRAAEDTLKTFREKNRRVMDSPELLLRQERLIREVTVRATIAVELKKQFELAKIEEIKNVTIVSVLDVARAPVKKERPKRLLNTVATFLLFLLGASAYFAFEPVYGPRMRQAVRLFNR